MRRILVGISGASGAPIAIGLLKRLQEKPDVETHLVMSHGAELTVLQETEYTVDEVKALADVVYDNRSIGERPASGSFEIDSMIIVPASMKTVAGIASGMGQNLLKHSADCISRDSGESRGKDDGSKIQKPIERSPLELWIKKCKCTKTRNDTMEIKRDSYLEQLKIHF